MADQVLGFRISYTPGQHIDIAGSRADLHALADLVAGDRVVVVAVRDQDHDPSPYELALSSITIEPSEGPIDARVRGAGLVISGGHDQRAILAQNISFLADLRGQMTGPIREHIHVDYYPDHPYLGPAAESMVFGISDPT